MYYYYFTKFCATLTDIANLSYQQRGKCCSPDQLGIFYQHTFLTRHTNGIKSPDIGSKLAASFIDCLDGKRKYKLGAQ